MLYAGDQVTVVVVGTIGATFFVDPVARITAGLVGQGVIVESAAGVDENLIDQVLNLDLFSTPYQLTLHTHVAENFGFYDVDTFARVVAKVVGQVAGTLPQSTTVTAVNAHVTTAIAPGPLESPSAAIGASVTESLTSGIKSVAGFTQSTVLLLGAVLIGIVALVAFGPNVKALRG